MLTLVHSLYTDFPAGLKVKLGLLADSEVTNFKSRIKENQPLHFHFLHYFGQTLKADKLSLLLYYLSCLLHKRYRSLAFLLNLQKFYSPPVKFPSQVFTLFQGYSAKHMRCILLFKPTQGHSNTFWKVRAVHKGLRTTTPNKSVFFYNFNLHKKKSATAHTWYKDGFSLFLHNFQRPELRRPRGKLGSGIYYSEPRDGFILLVSSFFTGHFNQLSWSTSRKETPTLVPLDQGIPGTGS